MSVSKPRITVPSEQHEEAVEDRLGAPSPTYGSRRWIDAVREQEPRAARPGAGGARAGPAATAVPCRGGSVATGRQTPYKKTMTEVTASTYQRTLSPVVKSQKTGRVFVGRERKRHDG